MKADDLHIQRVSSVFQNIREPNSRRNSPGENTAQFCAAQSQKKVDAALYVFERAEKRYSNRLSQLLYSDNSLHDSQLSQRISVPRNSQADSNGLFLQTGQSTFGLDKPITNVGLLTTGITAQIEQSSSRSSYQNVRLLTAHFSKVSKLTSNPFISKYKEKISAMAQTDNQLMKILDTSIKGDNCSLDSFTHNSNVEIENVRSLNLFFDNRQVPSHELFKSHMKHIFYETAEPEENDDLSDSEIKFIDCADDNRSPQQSKRTLWSEQDSLPIDIMLKIENLTHNPISFKSESSQLNAFANSFRMPNDWLIACMPLDGHMSSSTDCPMPLTSNQPQMYQGPLESHSIKLDLPLVGENTKEDDSQSEISKKSLAKIEMLGGNFSQSHLSDRQNSNKYRYPNTRNDADSKFTDKSLLGQTKLYAPNDLAPGQQKAKIKNCRCIPSFNAP